LEKLGAAEAGVGGSPKEEEEEKEAGEELAWCVKLGWPLGERERVVVFLAVPMCYGRIIALAHNRAIKRAEKSYSQQ